MPVYQVYYARRPTYVASGQLGTPLLTVSRLQHTHVHLTTIQAQNRADAWLQMQGENWSPHGEARPLIEMLDLTHTSMSVGDVLRDEAGVYWECLDLGWRAVEDDAAGNAAAGNAAKEADDVLHEKAAR
ncbi:MAG TPA: hypothetical protein PKO09_01615 [Anaerolineae bacterium]|nr:hypothetical protein [Anaerolineae bacterium]